MKPPRRPRILLLRTTNAPVARNDEACLTRHYDVRKFTVRLSPRTAFLRNMLALLWWMAWNIGSADGVFFRFVDYYAVIPAFFARLFRRKLWIVLGGYDAHWFPEHHFGVYDKPFRGWCARYTIRRATALLPVDESLYDGVNAYAFSPPRRTGVKSLVPGIRGVVRAIPDSFDGEFWKPDPTKPKENLVVTTASIAPTASERSRRQMVLFKGVPLLFEIARRLPDYRFAIVGPSRELLPPDLRDVPPNVAMPGFLSLEDLRAYYRRARVYAHPSYTEGCPASVAEGMLCACVPVGSRVNGIPLLVGEAGLLVDRHNVEDWTAAIERAMQMDTGTSARQRILAHFSPESRCRRLTDVLHAQLTS